MVFQLSLKYITVNNCIKLIKKVQLFLTLKQFYSDNLQEKYQLYVEVINEELDDNPKKRQHEEV